MCSTRNTLPGFLMLIQDSCLLRKEALIWHVCYIYNTQNIHVNKHTIYTDFFVSLSSRWFSAVDNTQKYKALILNYKPCILKYMPCLFYKMPYMFLHVWKVYKIERKLNKIRRETYKTKKNLWAYREAAWTCRETAQTHQESI